MKKSFKTLMTVLGCAALALACNKTEEVVNTMTADITAIKEVAAHNPAGIPVSITSNVNWIVQTPAWVHSDVPFGSGNAIVTFTVDENYINENTNTLPREGEIKISGGGTLNGKGVVLVIPISQLGYTKPYDPNASKGGIETADDLLEFAEALNSGGAADKWSDASGAVLLLEDIELPAGTQWEPAGNSAATSFKGVFNGNGHKITGLSFKKEATSDGAYGFFGFADGATIKNLTIEVDNFTVESNDCKLSFGCIVGKAVAGTEVTGCTVNAKSTGSMMLTRITGGSNKATYIGGIVGQQLGAKIENCTNNLPIKAVNEFYDNNGANGLHAGGILGWTNVSEGTTVAKCTNNAEIGGYLGTERAGSISRCGGIVGTGQGLITVTDCVNNGKINGTCIVTSDKSSRTSGIIAYTNVADCKISGCVNNGDIVFSEPGDSYLGYCAGIVGQTAKAITIEKCENYGAILTDNFIQPTVGTNCTGIIIARPNNQATKITACKVGGKIGPFSDPSQVITITAANFAEYLSGDSGRKTALVLTDNVFGAK